MFAHMEKTACFILRYPFPWRVNVDFTNDVDMLNQSLGTRRITGIIVCHNCCGNFIMMIILSPILTLVVVAMLGVMMFTIKYIGQRSAKNFETSKLL